MRGAKWLVLGLFCGLSAAGCCMCDHPYDFCGPTNVDGESFAFTRRGSALSYGAAYGAPAEYVEEVPAAAQGPAQGPAGDERYYDDAPRPQRNPPPPPPEDVRSALRKNSVRGRPLNGAGG